MRVQTVPPEALGWIAGDFDEAVVKTDSFEVGIKSGRGGEHEPLHYHAASYEHTYILRGTGTVQEDEAPQVDIRPGCVVTIPPMQVVAWDWDDDWQTVVIHKLTPSGNKPINREPLYKTK